MLRPSPELELGAWRSPGLGVLHGTPRTCGGAFQPRLHRACPGFVAEPHPNASRLCQGDWKFLLSSFSGVISTLLSGGRGGGARLLHRRCVLRALFSALGEMGRALLGLREYLGNNNKQPAPTTVTCIEGFLGARSCAKSRLAWPQGTFLHPGEAATVTQPTAE